MQELTIEEKLFYLHLRSLGAVVVLNDDGTIKATCPECSQAHKPKGECVAECSTVKFFAED
jgi:hypothetical protein